MNDTSQLPHAAWFVNARNLALLTGSIASLLGILGFIVTPTSFFPAYLTAYLFWLGIALGSLALAMIHYLAGGSWGFAIRRLLEAAFQTLPLLALLFVPLLFGLHRLYPWDDAARVSADPILRHHTLLLTPFWFVARAVLYFLVWIALAVRFRSWSLQQDRTRDPRIGTHFQNSAGPGLILYVFTMSMAAMDWIMSLEPRWYSTIFGLLVIVEQGLTALAFAVLMANGLARFDLSAVRSQNGFADTENSRPDAPPNDTQGISTTPGQRFERIWPDLGGLMIAFALIWVYMAYSQFVIIWSGDLPSEIAFYLHRRAGGWRWFGWAVILLHFVLPFAMLILGGTKRRVRLAIVASILLVAHYLFLFWLVVPTFHTEGVRVSWMDLTLPVALGGLWLASFFHALGKAPLFPTKFQEKFEADEQREYGDHNEKGESLENNGENE